jgi:D-glycero-D-manno-heptose 1,7-bisphosphate phosphatase
VPDIRPAAFIDRDGTLIEEVGYLDRLDRIEIFSWSVDAIRLLNRAGFAVVVVTNQAGIARGFFDEEFVRQTHEHLDRHFVAGGAKIDGYYYCPHHPDGTVAAYRQVCECRKPKPGMLMQAAAELDLDLTRSFVVGDRWLDIDLARAVGAPGILVSTGYGRQDLDRRRTRSDAAAIVSNLMAAVAWILQRGPKLRPALR